MKTFKTRRKLKIWLSATELSDQDLGQIRALLPMYEIVYNQASIESLGKDFTLDAHLAEIGRCDLFLGIINPKIRIPIETDVNIPLEEIKNAVALDLPYWYVVHRNVTFTRTLLKELILKSGIVQSSNKSVFDIRSVKIYQDILHTSLHKPNHQTFTQFFRLAPLLDQLTLRFSQSKGRNRQKMMLASTIYGFEDQLSKIIADMESFEFDVLNSYYGSLKVNPKQSNLENCLQSVEEADLFIGIVRPFFGTGNIRDKDAQDQSDINITWAEIKKAIEMEKPRWFFVHHDVEFAEKILNYVEVNMTHEAKASGLFTSKNILKPNNWVDVDAIDVYNYVIKDFETNLAMRNGNWAQEFYNMTEAKKYIQTQFQDKLFIESLLNQNTHE